MQKKYRTFTKVLLNILCNFYLNNNIMKLTKILSYAKLPSAVYCSSISVSGLDVDSERTQYSHRPACQYGVLEQRERALSL
jgi:hypothetical protein